LINKFRVLVNDQNKKDIKSFMLLNFLKTSIRSFIKNKTYSVLNIVGLSAGLTCFAFIVLWINDERSYDKFNTNFDRIFRVVSIEKRETGITESAETERQCSFHQQINQSSWWRTITEAKKLFYLR
jgi:hypothetical protein